MQDRERLNLDAVKSFARAQSGLTGRDIPERTKVLSGWNPVTGHGGWAVVPVRVIGIDDRIDTGRPEDDITLCLAIQDKLSNTLSHFKLSYVEAKDIAERVLPTLGTSKVIEWNQLQLDGALAIALLPRLQRREYVRDLYDYTGTESTGGNPGFGRPVHAL